VHSPPGVRPPVQLDSPAANPSTPLSLNQTMEMIHSRLREWSERKMGDKATDDRLTNELNDLLTDENAGKIIKLLAPEELHSPFGTSALVHWMKVDPITAADWVASRPDASDDQAWVIAHNLAANGIDLTSYAGRLPDGKWKQTYLLDAGIQVLSGDPGEVISLASQMDPGSAQTNLLQTAVTAWMSTDPDSTKNWIMTVSNPAIRDQLIAAAAKAYASSDPRQAVTWAVSTMSSGRACNDTIVNIVNNWSANDPADAAWWVSQLPDGDARTSAAGALLAHWMQSNRSAATTWAQSMPEGNKILARLSADQPAN